MCHMTHLGQILDQKLDTTGGKFWINYVFDSYFIVLIIRCLRHLFTELIELAQNHFVRNVQVVIHFKLSAPQVPVQFKNKLHDSSNHRIW